MKKLFFTLSAALFLFSCGKESSEDSNQGKTKTQLITQQVWKFENLGVDADRNGSIDQDLSAGIDPCIKDNTMKFETDGSGTVDEGLTKCSDQDPQTTPFNWNFAANETLLNLSGNATLPFRGQFEIYLLDENKLSLRKDTTVVPFGTVTILANLKH